MYIWASAVELGCSREGSFRVSTVLYLSARSRGGGKEQSAICSWAPVLLPEQSEPWGRGAQPASSSSSAPFRWLPFLPGRIAKAIRCHTASQECQQHSGRLANIHPPSLRTTTQSPGFAARLLPGPLFSRAESHSQVNASTLQEPQSLVEYRGLQLVKQEGVSNTGNAHPIGSGWLHTAPLPSARKESASAMLPPHMVTYNTSGFSFPLLSLMCLIFFNFLYIFFTLNP